MMKKANPVVPLSTTVWVCQLCKNTNGNFAHRHTCAACGGGRMPDKPRDEPALMEWSAS
jgi:hypothetical protein